MTIRGAVCPNKKSLLFSHIPVPFIYLALLQTQLFGEGLHDILIPVRVLFKALEKESVLIEILALTLLLFLKFTACIMTNHTECRILQ